MAMRGGLLAATLLLLATHISICSALRPGWAPRTARSRRAAVPASAPREVLRELHFGVGQALRFGPVVAISLVLAGCPVGLGVWQPPAALAFENHVEPVFKGPRTPGPEPKDLGLNEDGLLKACLRPNPNCFSTTPIDDPNTGEPEVYHTLSQWSFKGDAAAAYKAIDEVLQAYEPGHDNIDGGGFRVVKSGADSGKGYYAYAQFESYRRGYRDDLEIAASPGGEVQIRSSSRVGYLDSGVNAKRINYIADRLAAKGAGFTTEKITTKTHPVYFEENAR